MECETPLFAKLAPRDLAVRPPPFNCQPLGDAAVLADCTDEATAQRLGTAACSARVAGIDDIVVAYQSVGVYYESTLWTHESVVAWLHGLLMHGQEPTARRWRIPCCYEFGMDFEVIASRLQIPSAELVALHSATVFRVCAIGFSPGFPYLGYLPERLQGLPRLPQPRVRVDAGSIGITGRQGCIYPTSTPGGWLLVGRTPLCLVDPPSEYFPLRAGDEIQFLPIDRAEFNARLGERLDVAGQHVSP